MTKQMWGKCAAGLGIVTFGISAALPAQTAAPDPWKRVPPVPTSCYADAEFATQVNATIQETSADIDRQKDLNATVKERFDAMDIMEKAQRMQAFMMKNPQEAMKLMQADPAAVASATAAVQATARLDKELADHKSAFEAAVDKAVKPVLARQEVLIQTTAKFVGEGVLAAADHAQHVALVQQENAEYEKACAPYFGPKGAFNAWLENYRTDVIDKMIAVTEANDAMVVGQMAIMDTPTGGYRSTAKLEGVHNYLRQLYKVSSYRRPKARPRFELAK